MPTQTRRTIVKALGGLTALGFLTGCAETGEDEEEGDD